MVLSDDAVNNGVEGVTLDVPMGPWWKSSKPVGITVLSHCALGAAFMWVMLIENVKKNRRKFVTLHIPPSGCHC